MNNLDILQSNIKIVAKNNSKMVYKFKKRKFGLNKDIFRRV